MRWKRLLPFNRDVEVGGTGGRNSCAMLLRLRASGDDGDTIRLEGVLPALPDPSLLSYSTRTGAIARIDGRVAGAFDREHRSILVPPSSSERLLILDVEPHALPTHGLPAGDGIRWRMMLARAEQSPSLDVRVDRANGSQSPHARDDQSVALWGHAHLDVAWLWPYSQTRRKASRTFANALALIERDPAYVFVQSQPQLYAYVESEEPELFARVSDAVRSGRFNAEAAALWVEPDCNIPSGESLLRQMLHAHAYCVARFGLEPSFAWLPDTFGFANTLPTLLAHAGIGRFATTKLRWNDTTQFEHPQFRWRGPDGSEVLAALLDAYEGSATAARVAIAHRRHEPLVIGYSDGGGGPTFEQVERAQTLGTWQPPSRWFEQLEARREALPVHQDELYLEYHRGTYTTHHDVKALNARLERELAEVEERIAWCIAVRSPGDVIDRLRAQIADVWTIVLRNQFHDVLPGTSVRSAYEESLAEYELAIEMLAAVRASTEAMLPRSTRDAVDAFVAPVEDDGEYVFDNGIITARVSATGALLHLAGPGIPNVVAQANLLAAYRDRPRKWEAWNLDAGYERHRVAVKPKGHDVLQDALAVRFDAGGSPLVMHLSLRAGDPYLRVDAAVDWRADRTILRMENWLALDAQHVRYGSPHGTIERTIARETPAQRARYEVPGQRFASVKAENCGVAVFALDTYGWSARALRRGGTQIGHSLLRSTRWPDPLADRGEQQFAWAFAPHAGAPVSSLERAWEHFAHAPRVRLFTPADDSILVAAVKPAADGDGVILRLRECDGANRAVRVRSAARVRTVTAVDALERSIDEAAEMEGEHLVATIPAFGLRSYRVRFG